MTTCTLDSSVVDWVIDYPEAAAVFRALGIDDSYSGKSLGYACLQRGLGGSWVLAELEWSLGAVRGPPATEPTSD